MNSTIELGKRDLLTFSKKDILLLARYLNIRQDKNIDHLAEKIARKLLVNKSEMPRGDLPYGGDYQKALDAGDADAKAEIIAWYKSASDEELAELTAENVPYGGVSQKALQVRDMDAVRVIFRWQGLTESQRRKELMKEEAEKEIPEQAKDCTNVLSFIDQEDWDADHLPDVKITLLDSEDPEKGPKRTLCYQKENLEKIQQDKDSVYYVWIGNRDGSNPDAEGYGGGPSDQKLLLIPDELYIYDAFIPPDNQIIGVPIGRNVRVGNRFGAFSVSGVHGQAPGKTIYYLLPANSDIEQDLHDTMITMLMLRAESFAGVDILDIVGQELEDKFNTTFGDYLVKRLKGAKDPGRELEFYFSGPFNELDFFEPDGKLKRDYIDKFIDHVNDADYDSAIDLLKDILDRVKDSQEIGDEDSVYYILTDNGLAKSHMIELLSELSLTDKIKIMQDIYQKSPETDLDYDNGYRVGPELSPGDVFEDPGVSLTGLGVAQEIFNPDYSSSPSPGTPSPIEPRQLFPDSYSSQSDQPLMLDNHMISTEDFQDLSVAQEIYPPSDSDEFDLSESDEDYDLETNNQITSLFDPNNILEEGFEYSSDEDYSEISEE